MHDDEPFRADEPILADSALTDAPHVDPPTDPIVEALAVLERSDSLDALAEPVLDAARDIVGSGAVGDFLTGEWLGHPLHPVLVDLPIGFWTSGVMIDLLMPRRGHDAARKLIGLGVVAAVPAALAGWADASRRDAAADRRVSIVHAASMASATMMFAVSWQARRRDHHAVGKAWALLGSVAATGGGALGGHLAFGQSLTEEEPVPEQLYAQTDKARIDKARRDEDWLKADSNVACRMIPCLLLPGQ